jgi:hemoglobin
MPEDPTAPTANIVPEPTRRPIPVTLRLGAHGESATGNFFEEVGGQETFDRLVRAFYERVRQDPVLWRMYPQDDYEGAIHRLSTFLQQFWGGPRTYIEERGHPRLIKRHAAFKVNPDARDRWLGHMRAALDELALPPLQDATLWGNLDSEAHALVNTFSE